MPVAVPTRSLPAFESSFAGGGDSVFLRRLLAHTGQTALDRCHDRVDVTTAVAIVSFKMKPVYRATARVQVESETPMIQSIEDVFRKTSADDTYVQTQIQVLESESLAWRTIEQLDAGITLPALRNPPVFRPINGKLRLIDTFKRRVSVNSHPRPGCWPSTLKTPTLSWPRVWRRLWSTDAHGSSFRQKYDATRQASAWMEQQLDELKAKVETSQQLLVEYERDHRWSAQATRAGCKVQVLSDLAT